MPHHIPLHDPPRNHHQLHQQPNSPFFEALATYNCKDLDELKRLVSQYQPDLLPVLHSIVPQMTTDLSAAIELLQIREAKQRLGTMDELLQLAIQLKLGAILPLPPHIFGRLISVLPPECVFASEDDLPPHFPWCTQLDGLMPSEALTRMGAFEAFVVDGFEEGTALHLRRSVVRILQILLPRRPRLFLHSLPHRPRHADLVMFLRDDLTLVRI